MRTYKVLEDFKGREPSGHSAILYEEGETVELPDDLADIFQAQGWIEEKNSGDKNGVNKVTAPGRVGATKRNQSGKPK